LAPKRDGGLAAAIEIHSFHHHGAVAESENLQPPNVPPPRSISSHVRWSTPPARVAQHGSRDPQGECSKCPPQSHLSPEGAGFQGLVMGRAGGFARRRHGTV